MAMVEKRGNEVIINTWLAIISLILLLGSTLVSIVTLTVSAQNNIEQNAKSINELKEIVEEVHEQLNSNRDRIAVIETHYEHIQNQLDRIETKLDEK